MNAERKQELISVNVTINGESIKAEVPPDLTLLRFLRDHLNLTGTKDGCSSGHCGTCTVILNGKAERSCLIKMKRAKDGVVETIEGLAQNGQLHPLQEAFIAHSAMQCGYCTPGMIMTAKALLAANPHPSAHDIRKALTQNRNLCRCTGYTKIIEAIQDAARYMAAGETYPTGNESSIGIRLRGEAVDLVTGHTRFADDIREPNMIYGKIRWVDHPRAEIVNVDVSEAETLEGVVTIVTAADIPGKNAAGYIVRDQPAIASEVTHYIGDAVACVFATSPEIANAAREKIKIEYRILPGIFSPEEAASPGAPLAHERGNLMYQAKIERGDVQTAFGQCAAIVEREYSMPFIEHGFLEPESGIAIPDPHGGVTIKIGSQTVFTDRQQLSEILALPEEKVRVIHLPTGGAFGAKEELLLHQYLALGALKVQRPVKITLTREESLRVHPKRHLTRIHIKSGADADGRLLAVEAHLTLDGGAYTSLSMKVLDVALFSFGPYFVPNLYLAGHVWYTNNVPGGAMRGFGANQSTFALESNLDELARQLEMDPFEFRLINALDVGLPTVSDNVMEPGVVSIKETLQAARDEFSRTDVPASRDTKKVGVGVACGIKTVGFGGGRPESAGAIIELNASGDCLVRVSQHEIGQGAYAALVQIASSELGLAPEFIRLIGPDTAITPKTGATTASRQTFLTGNAVILAAHKLRRELAGRAAEMLDAAPDRLRIEGDSLVNIENGRTVLLSELGERIVVEERYQPPETVGLPESGLSKYGKPDFVSRLTHWCYSFCSQVAIVEVDETTGEVRVLKVISANDVGKAINPAAVEGQIQGGVVMGIGYALSEEFVVEKGINLTDSLHKCKLPTAGQVPEIVTVILEIPHPLGPWGAKGLAEAPTLPVAPAIANAIYDAVGVRITSLPARKEKVLAALRAEKGGDRGGEA